jgi:hypothetical protein
MVRVAVLPATEPVKATEIVWELFGFSKAWESAPETIENSLALGPDI